MTALDAVTLALLCVAIVLAGLRWLRVAQREHYLPWSVGRFAGRWWRSSPADTAAVTVAVVAAALCWVWRPAALVEAAVFAAAPFRLGVRGRTSRLVWTRRLSLLASVVALLAGAGVAAGSAGGLSGATGAASVVALLVPLLVDVSLALTRPVEDALAGRYVRRAAEALAAVSPLVVAITGSYGKTTTKGYIAHLASGRRRVVASPASFNNRAGLARTVNEHLTPDTQVLVAEMGTYGPGEIAEMCSWLRPTVSVITAIGPAHLERFRSLDRTLAAKSEIAAGADVVVLNVDDERLAGLAAALRSEGRRVVGASGSSPEADVAVLPVERGLELRVGAARAGVVGLAEGQRPTSLSNLACAAAVALELGVAPHEVLMLLPTVPVPPNRLERYVADGGYVVLDDTFNSNPAGARLALTRLAEEAPAGRRVLVTPGMVELGATQFEENARLAEEACTVVSDLVVVARTNRRALVEGVRRAGSPVSLQLVERLDDAVGWVRAHLVAGDAVLYENDLPDHFP